MDLHATLCAAVDDQRHELQDFLASLAAVRATGSTGAGYHECVSLIADKLSECDADVDLIEVPRAYLESAWGRGLEKTREYLPVTEWAPRVIVLARRKGRRPHPSLHLTQHYDVPGFVPAGPAVVFEDGKVFAGGVSGCRSGLVSMIMAVRALRGAGVELGGDLFVSATPDNHLGGETGAGFLSERGHGRSEFVVTGGAGGPREVGLGYKGALWVKVTTTGRAAPASEPAAGIDAIDKMTAIHRALLGLAGDLSRRTTEWPVVPASARSATLVPARIRGGGFGVADRCEMFIDRRVSPEEDVRSAFAEIEATIARLNIGGDEHPVDVSLVHAVEPSVTAVDSPLVQAFERNIRRILGGPATQAVYPNYSEFRFFPSRWGAETINYGPGSPAQVYAGAAEHVVVEDIVAATKVMAASIVDLIG